MGLGGAVDFVLGGLGAGAEHHQVDVGQRDDVGGARLGGDDTSGVSPSFAKFRSF